MFQLPPSTPSTTTTTGAPVQRPRLANGSRQQTPGIMGRSPLMAKQQHGNHQHTPVGGGAVGAVAKSPAAMTPKSIGHPTIPVYLHLSKRSSQAGDDENSASAVNPDLAETVHITQRTPSETTITIHHPSSSSSSSIGTPSRMAPSHYSFNQVFTKYEDVFDGVLAKQQRPMPGAASEKYRSFTLATYGHAVHGKSQCLYGGSMTEYPGAIALSLQRLFKQLSAMNTNNAPLKHGVWMVAVEHTGGDRVVDLLHPHAVAGRAAPAVELRHRSANQQVVIEQVTQQRVHTLEQALAVVDRVARRARVFGVANAGSPRGHLLLSVYCVECPKNKDLLAPAELECRVMTDYPAGTAMTRWTFADLAGRERVKPATAAGLGSTATTNIKEIAGINQSLSVLQRCLAAMGGKAEQRTVATPGKQHVATHPYIPFRNSKLTQLLQCDLSKHAFSLLICVDPSPAAYEETMNTFGFLALTMRQAGVDAGVGRTDTGLMAKIRRRLSGLQASPVAPKVDEKQQQQQASSPVSAGANAPPATPSDAMAAAASALPPSTTGFRSPTSPSSTISTATDYTDDNTATTITEDSQHSVYDIDSELMQELVELESTLRNQMIQEHLQQTEQLRQEYEQLLHESLEESELKAGKKMDILSKEYERQLDGWRVREQQWLGKERALEARVRELERVTSSSSNNAQLSAQVEQMLASSEKYIHDLEATTQEVIQQIREEYQRRESEWQAKQCAVEQELAREKQCLKDRDAEIDRLQYQLATETAAAAMMPLDAEVAKLSISDGTPTKVDPTNAAAPVKPAYSPLLGGVGLKSAFRSVIPAQLAATKSKSKSKQLQMSATVKAAVAQVAAANNKPDGTASKRTKKLRQRRAVFDEDDDD